MAARLLFCVPDFPLPGSDLGPNVQAVQADRAGRVSNPPLQTIHRCKFGSAQEPTLQTNCHAIPKYPTALRRDRPRRAFRWGKLADLSLARRLAFPRRFFSERIREKPSRSPRWRPG